MKNRFMNILILLLLATSSAQATSIDWKHGLEGFVTRCFDVKDVKASCDDLTGYDEHLIREELQIEAKYPGGEKFAYIYGKGIEGNLCRTHLRKIRKLLRKVGEVCVSGFSESRIDDGTVVVRWSGLETRRGEIIW